VVIEKSIPNRVENEVGGINAHAHISAEKGFIGVG
jgi:hypothetical protein